MYAELYSFTVKIPFQEDTWYDFGNRAIDVRVEALIAKE